QASSDIDQAINRIQGSLPEDVDPEVITGSSDQIPAVVFAVTSSLDQDELAKRLDDVVVPELSEVGGVRSVEVTGVREQQISVELDDKKLAKAGRSASSVTDALKANGTPVPAGAFDEDSKSVSVQVAKKFGSVEELENIYLTPSAAGGGRAAPKPKKLGDVAKVTLDDAEATSITRTDGKPSLGLMVTAAPEGNNVQISDEIRDELPGLSDRIGHDTELTVVFDQA